jgi:Uma2 family endonuclease
MIQATATAKPIVYPDSDGEPIAENTLQFEWIVTIKGGLDAVFLDDPNVFVAGDLLWYPVEGEPNIRQAPDTLVAFGRPKGYRGSYLQWKEDGTAPQVVFEVLSPGNRFGEMVRKFDFYEKYGVEEYYVFDPDRLELFGWIRQVDKLVSIPSMNGWKSPLLNVLFELTDDLHLYGPDGREFVTYTELAKQRAQAERETEAAQREKEAAQLHAEEQAKAAERLRAQLKALGADPEA